MLSNNANQRRLGKLRKDFEEEGIRAMAKGGQRNSGREGNALLTTRAANVEGCRCPRVRQTLF